MESVEFWGIVFRSVAHMKWFKLSVILFSSSIFWFAASCFVFKEKNTVKSIQTLSWWSFAAMHIWASLIALVVTKGGTVNGVKFSVDCIWFNALMAAVYIGLCFLAIGISKIYRSIINKRRRE